MKKTAVIQDEYRDSDGYWIYLKPGYQCRDDRGTHGIVEPTKTAAYSRLSAVIPCDCEDCQRQPGYRVAGEPPVKTKTVKKKTSRKKRTRVLRYRPNYNKDFTPVNGDEGHTFKVKRIPTPFWEQVIEKANREGTSLRGMVLEMFEDYVEEGGQ